MTVFGRKDNVVITLVDAVIIPSVLLWRGRAFDDSITGRA